MIELSQQTTYRPVTRASLDTLPQAQQLPPSLREEMEVVSAVFPFRTNAYVVQHLIDWDKVPNDPIYQLTFPQRGMLSEGDFDTIATLIRRGAPSAELRAAADAIRLRHNPHPAGQLTHNIPKLDGKPLPGLQHKYPETVLFFPSRGQTCHAYCSYCFRWAQFVGLQNLKFAAKEANDLARYLHAHPEVTDVLFTGGDPMIMKTRALRDYIEPLLTSDLTQLQTIRIGTKALAYWPQRFVTDDDAGDLLRLFEQIIRSGRHVAIMAHYSHPRELATPVRPARGVTAARCGLRDPDAAPIIRHVNDSRKRGRRSGGTASSWDDPLLPVHQPRHRQRRLLRGAAGRVVCHLPQSLQPGFGAGADGARAGHVGHARQGADHGVTQVGGQRVFVLTFLQGRDPAWVKRPFFAHYDPAATVLVRP